LGQSDSTPALTSTVKKTHVPASTPDGTRGTPAPSVPPISSLSSILLILAVGMMAVLAGMMVTLLRHRPLPQPAPLAPGEAPTLFIQRGPSAGQNIPISTLPCRIGRGELNDVNIFALHVSRQHAQIYANHQAYYLVDLGSKNGTFVNGKQIKNQSVALHNGDQLKFGRDVLAEFRLQMDMGLTI
jgi:hypothetical protein